MIPMNETIRLFFAIEVPEDIKLDLEKFGATLERPWRPVKRELMHITLAFMGAVAVDDMDRIKMIGTQAAENAEAFNLEIVDASVFPESGDPRVLYAQADGGSGLTGLVGLLREKLSDLADQKKFKPHLTLARSKGDRARRVIRRFRGSWPVKDFALFKSALTVDGPQYEMLQRFDLKVIEQAITAEND